jgi:hypothetical protein
VANAVVQAISLDRRMGYEPSTSIGIGQYDGLEVFLSDPEVAIDTNHLERALR